MVPPVSNPAPSDSHFPDSAQRRRFRALARSAPWLSTSLRLSTQVPQHWERSDLGLRGSITILLRGREAIAISDAQDQLLFQRERFTADRGLDYVAASASSWELPASLVTPVFSDDHLIARRPAIQGFDDLVPLPFLEMMLDPYELAGEEPAALELSFDHPTFIHELREGFDAQGRKVVEAVLSPGHTYRESLPGLALVPAHTKTLVVLDRQTGIAVKRTVLEGPAHPELELRILAHNEYYIDSLFTSPTPTLTDVRQPWPWTVRSERK